MGAAAVSGGLPVSSYLCISVSSVPGLGNSNLRSLLLQIHKYNKTMAFLTIVRRVDVDKIMRQTHIMLRMLLCFDVFFLVSTVVQMVWMSPVVANTNNGQWDMRFLTSEAYLHGYCMLSLFIEDRVQKILELKRKVCTKENGETGPGLWRRRHEQCGGAHRGYTLDLTVKIR